MQIDLAVGPGRNWANLWKPVVDALGPVLGEGSRPFHPQDDRVVQLAFHRQIIQGLGHEIRVEVWWRGAGV